MDELSEIVVSLRPFVPAKDFETSKRFYIDLGFRIELDGEDVAEMRIGPHAFLLQAFHEKSWHS